MSLDQIAFVDIETTGSRAESDRIIEIAIICVKDNKFCKEFSTLVNPQMPFSPFIEMITGIKPSDVKDAPTFEDIHQEVYELLEDKLFIAHNVSFDYGFIKHEFKRLGLTFKSDRCCTVKLSRHFYPQHRRHNLDSLIERFDFDCENRHRAYSDTSVLWQFYQHLNKEYTPEKVAEAVQFVSKRPSLPPNIDTTIIEKLPEKPGVYIFYGDQQLPLYIGKSKNIRERVWGHFTLINESTKERDIAQQIKNIEFIETPGELGALLLESKLVKELQPIYNRRLRKCEELVYIIKTTDKYGYIIPQIETFDPDDSFDFSSILAVHKTKSQAKKHLESLQDEYQLCRVLLGIENSKTSCFNHKLGRCLGACLQKENATIYNSRFEEAFSRTQIPSWPYKNPVMISEQDIETKVGHNHIFHNWRYLGAVRVETDITSFDSNMPSSFDFDKYMILKNYLKHHSNIREISYQEIEKLQNHSIS